MTSVDPWYACHVRAFEQEKGPSWQVKRLIGEGASAAVLHVTQGEHDYALKLYRPEFCRGENAPVEQRRLRLQNTLRDHDCPTLVGIHEVGELEGSAFILMELVDWPSMDTVLGAIPRTEIQALVRDVASAAKWLHDRGLVHRDIKPANVLVSPDFSKAKLVDLGVLRADDNDEADMTDQGARRPFIATAQYSSPEYLFRLVEPSADLWRALTFYQLGGVLHDLIMRKPLFQTQVETANKYVLAMAVHSLMPDIQAADVSPKLIALAKRCLEKSMKVRLTRVQWADFLEVDSFDVNAARSRLRLGVSAGRDLGKSLEQIKRHQELAAKQSLTRVCDCVAHVLSSEKYPRVVWFEDGERSARFLFSLPNSSSGAKLQGSIVVGLHETQSDWIDIHVDFDVVSNDGAPVKPRSGPIWSGPQDQVAVAIEGELKDLLADSLLRAYAAADDLVTADPKLVLPRSLT